MKKTSTLTLLLILLISLTSFAQSDSKRNYVENEILVRFKKDATEKQIEAIRTALGATELDVAENLRVHHWQLPPFPIKVDPKFFNIGPSTSNTPGTVNDTPGTTSVILGRPEVDGVGWNYEIGVSPSFLSGIYSDREEFDPLISCYKDRDPFPGNLFANTDGGGTVNITIIDTGLGIDEHPDLFEGHLGALGNFTNNNSFVVPNASFEDLFVVEDENGHGSAVAGLISAMLEKSGSMDYRLNIFKAFDESGYSKLSDVINAIEESINVGSDIINMSWGFYPDNDDNATHNFTSHIIADSNLDNVLFVASAGNTMIEINNKRYLPGGLGAYGNVLTVAATNCDGSLADFANYSKQNVDIGVAGVEVLVPTIEGWGIVNGSSFSVGIASAVAAQLQSINPNLAGWELELEIYEQSVPVHSLINDVISGAVINIPNNYSIRPVIPVETKADFAAEQHVYPNPFFNEINVQFQSNLSGKANLNISDQFGRVVLQQSIFINQGSNQLVLQAQLAPGIYTLQVAGENIRFAKKLIRMR